MLICVTATLNGLDHTRRLITALSEVNTIPLRAVVIDQGSTDGTVEWLRTVPAVTLIEHERNTGAAAAWNLGIRVALLNGAEAILVCGNDTAPMPGTVERLYGLLREGALFVTGTQVAYDAPAIEVPPCPSDLALLAAPDFSFFMFVPTVVDAVGKWDASTAHGVATQMLERGIQQPHPVVMSPWDWGLADSRFVVGYTEDNDWHMRLKQAGVPALQDPGAFFWHDCSLTIRINPEVGRLNQERTFRQNLELFRAKWGTYPAECDIHQARPGNVTDEQWTAMNGHRAVAEVPREQMLEQAKAVYAKYGVTLP